MPLQRFLIISVTGNLVAVGLVLAGWVAPNVQTTFNPTVAVPVIAETARIHPLATVNGEVTIGDHVFVAPAASIRGDEGTPIHIGEDSNVQDGVVIHGLETFDGHQQLPDNQVEVDGKKYSVYIGQRVSLAHQSQVHGPAIVGDDTFVGMQALVFRAELGHHVVIEPAAKVIGVKISPWRYVPAGSIVTEQVQADGLPKISSDYAYRNLNTAVIHVNVELAEARQSKTPAH